MSCSKSTSISLGILILLFASACSTLPRMTHTDSSIAFNSGAETTLGRLFEPPITGHAGESGVELVDTGSEALQLRLAMLAVAERAVDLQYYIWNDDDSGRLMIRQIVAAADRGIRVRLLLDDFNANGRDGHWRALDAHPNIQVRLYNPNPDRSGIAKWLGLLWNFGPLNQRMHNKSFVVDGSVAIIGGRNIGDEYFDLGESLNFRDRELLAVGPVVAQISKGFDDYWNSAHSIPIITLDPRGIELGGELTLTHSPLSATQPEAATQQLREWRSRLVWANVEVLIDEPHERSQESAEHRRQLAQRLTRLAESAEGDILIESAYLVLGEPGLALLGDLTGRGVRVRALTNSLASNDLTTNHAAYARRRRQMLENGIDLYELRPDAASCRAMISSPSRCAEGSLFGLHSKSIVFDRSKVFVGSFNLNLRSVYLNSEIGLLIDSPELADRIAEDIENNMQRENSWQVVLDSAGDPQWLGWENGGTVRYSSEPETGFWRRLKSGVLSLLPIEKYL